MLKVSNSQQFIAKLRKDKKKVEFKISHFHRRLVESILRDLIATTPQWSGNLASNWVIEYKGVAGTYNPVPGYTPPVRNAGLGEQDPYRRGSDPAVSDTLDRELKKLAGIRYNTIVTIVNKAPYANEVQDGKGPFGRTIRDVNLFYGRVAMVAYIHSKYSKLNTLRKLAL